MSIHHAGAPVHFLQADLGSLCSSCGDRRGCLMWQMLLTVSIMPLRRGYFDRIIEFTTTANDDAHDAQHRQCPDYSLLQVPTKNSLGTTALWFFQIRHSGSSDIYL